MYLILFPHQTYNYNFSHKSGESEESESVESSSASDSVLDHLPSPSLAALSSSITSIRPITAVWNADTIPKHLLLPAKVTRISTCELEVDAIFSDILNRMQIGSKLKIYILCFCLILI